MTADEIKERLIISFSRPLREYYSRRVIFWDDPEKEFVDVIDDIELENVTILQLSDKNTFLIKNKINDDSTGDLLIYDSTNTDLHQDWLADARLYCEEIMHFDYYSMLMARLNIIETRQMRNAIKDYKNFFANEKRLEKLHSICPVIKDTTTLHLGILAVLTTSKKIEPVEIIYNIFKDGLNNDENDSLKRIRTFGSEKVLWTVINRYAGDCKENLNNAFITILASALYQSMGSSIPAKLKNYVINQTMYECQSLLLELTHNNIYSDYICKLIERVESKLEIKDAIDTLSLDSLVDSELLPCINDSIINKLCSGIASRALSSNKIISVIEKRRTLLWYEKYKDYYECIYSMGMFIKQQENFMEGFHYISAEDVWKEYTDKIYLFDEYYRHTHKYLYDISLNSIPSVQDKLQEAIDQFENEYKNWYLDKINATWINNAKESLSTTGKAFYSLNQLSSFFDTYIDSKIDDKITFVIISDGMRYEVGKELSERMNVRLRGNVKIDAMQATFPAITKYGMAALLPGKKSVDDNYNVMVDGKTIPSVASRDSVLKARNEDFAAISYVEFNGMKSVEKKEFVKGKKVIYIYHDDIDSLGHDSSGESKVFAACEETIQKLITFSEVLIGVRASCRIIITADHGFIYSYKKLDEASKISVKSDEIVDALGEKRCVVAKNPIDTDILVPVKMQINNSSNSLCGYAPYQSIRLKANGGASNYVHGGISLQEITVPIIEFDSLRSDSKAYTSNKDKYDHNAVRIELVTKKKTIYTLIESFEFYQKDPVNDFNIEAIYDVQIEDILGKQVSDTAVITANKTDLDPSNRKFKITLNIKPGNYNKDDKYTLVIYNQKTKESIIKETISIDISSGCDFDF